MARGKKLPKAAVACSVAGDRLRRCTPTLREAILVSHLKAWFLPDQGKKKGSSPLSLLLNRSQLWLGRHCLDLNVWLFSNSYQPDFESVQNPTEKGKKLVGIAKTF
jgi:hypothetical protein